MIHALLAGPNAFPGLSDNLWYALWLVAAISLVYGATRHERMRPILGHAARVAFWIVSFMVGVFVALTLVLWCL